MTVFNQVARTLALSAIGQSNKLTSLVKSKVQSNSVLKVSQSHSVSFIYLYIYILYVVYNGFILVFTHSQIHTDGNRKNSI